MPTAMRASAAGYDLPDVPEPSGDAFAKAVSLLLPYLLSHRSRLASAGGERSEDGERGGAGASGGATADASAGGGSAGRAERGADTGYLCIPLYTELSCHQRIATAKNKSTSLAA